MQADGRLVENEDGIGLRFADLARKLQPLRFAAGEARRFLAERQIAEAEPLQNAKLLADGLHIPAEVKRGSYIHVHELRQGHAFAGLICELHIISGSCVARAAAVGARDVDVRQELHVQTHLARPVTAGAAEGAGVVGKVARLIAPFLCVGRSRIQLPQLVVDARVGGDRRADIDADGRGVDELDMRNTVGFDCADMRGQGAAADACLQSGNEALEHHGGLAGAGHTGDDGQPSLRDLDLQRLDGMDLRRGQMHGPICKHSFLRRPGPQLRLGFSGEEGTDLGRGVFLDRRDRPLRDDVSALRARFRTHLYDPVGFL